jgi:uncharacterized protein YndB with AHSA1/START domain
MSLRLQASVTVRARPARVFDLVCTPERLPDWNVAVVSARRAEPSEPVKLGSRAIFSGRLLGQTVESETQVVEYQPPCRFVTQAIRGPRLITSIDLQPQDEGTVVHVDVSGDVPGGVLGERLAAGFLRRELTASLERLKIVAEGSSEE